MKLDSIMNFINYFSYNSVVIISYFLICLTILILNKLLKGKVNRFLVFNGGSLFNPMTYIRLVTSGLCHSGWHHFRNNFILILLIGPMLEDKYGSIALLQMLIITTIICTIVHYIIYGHGAIGASDNVYMLVVLCSIVNITEGTIPITLVLIFIFYIADEIIKQFSKKKDNVEKKVVLEAKKEEIKKEESKVVKKEKKQTDYKTKDAIIIMILSMIIGIGIGCVATRLLSEKKHPKELKEFDESYVEIVDNYYGIFNKKDLVYSSISGLLGGLNDRYAYLNTDQNAILNYEEGIEGYFNGLGVMISINAEGNIEISAVYEDSPAQKSGVLVGDVISTMEGKKYGSYNYGDFSYNIKSSKVGTKLDFELIKLCKQ